MLKITKNNVRIKRFDEVISKYTINMVLYGKLSGCNFTSTTGKKKNFINTDKYEKKFIYKQIDGITK